MRLLTRSSLLAGLLWLAAGCASTDVNPAKAHAGKGYVDFYADKPGLVWQVECLDPHSQSYQTAFAELKPPADNFVRLACAPGEHQFRITFANRVVISPAEISVNVEEGRIVPVHVVTAEAGPTQVDTKTYTYGSTFRGGTGRRTHFNTGETAACSLTATAGAPVAYQTKQRMHYGN
jgi:hypothetical protein